jgi:signal transduction histidine kinase
VGIIDEILCFARIDAGKERVIVERADAAEIAREAAALVAPLAAAKGLALVVEVSNGDVSFYSDPGKVRQILVNLLGNAVKFTNEGEVRLTAQLTGDRVSFEVRDTGIGIPADKLGRVFDPFWQAEQGKTRQSVGTGLGLSVVRQLTALLGGEVRVASTAGVGSAFTVILPLVAPVSAERAA